MKHRFPILLVEDNPVSCKLIEKTLTNAGHEVTAAENGRQAIEVFRERFFPIVLTDWMMPEMDGVELCREIRSTNAEGYVYIILLTAKDSKEDIVTGLKAGADDYLSKPISHPELIARLNTGIRILELERSLKEANEEIRILSITDPLTGCFNRGYMNQHLLEEIKRSRRYGHPLCVFLCDIDHFKRLNDIYGHQAGDAVLREFAQQIRKTIRADLDWVVRYGGEEFLVVLPETNFEGACIMGERLRHAVEKMEIEHGEQTIRITASFGVTGVDSRTDEEKVSPEAMISLADKCLYQAKNKGRNRVCEDRL